MDENNGSKPRKFAVLALCCTLGLSVAAGQREAAAQPEETSVIDARFRLELAAPQRDLVLLEMRTMLESVNDILEGLIAADAPAMENAARRAGMTMAADVDPEIQAVLPQPFLQLGVRTHQAFDELAESIAGGGDSEEILQGLAAITGNCVGCHAAFRLDEKR